MESQCHLELKQKIFLSNRVPPCSSSPPAGGITRQNMSTMSATRYSDCPTPTVSTITMSKPAASHSTTASLVLRVTPPRCPPAGDGLGGNSIDLF